MSDESCNNSCCVYRRKIIVAVVAVLPEEQCGVPESSLADLLRFDIALPSGHPVLAFLYCPWCGEPRSYDGETRITDSDPVQLPDPESPDQSYGDLNDD